MKISTYRKRLQKEDYNKEHIQYPETEEVSSRIELIKIQQETAWGPQIFSGYRNKLDQNTQMYL